MFFSKLRQTDSFGLVTFNNQGHTLIPLQRVCDLNIDDVTKTVKGIHTNGGTTLITGFK